MCKEWVKDVLTNDAKDARTAHCRKHTVRSHSVRGAMQTLSTGRTMFIVGSVTCINSNKGGERDVFRVQCDLQES